MAISPRDIDIAVNLLVVSIDVSSPLATFPYTLAFAAKTRAERNPHGR